MNTITKYEDPRGIEYGIITVDKLSNGEHQIRHESESWHIIAPTEADFIRWASNGLGYEIK
jgi:hypothetical protein